jgi:transposase
MGKLRLSKKERLRIEVLSKIQQGGMSLRKGADLLGLSYRQILRVHQRYELEGNSGLQHRLRGQESNRRFESGRRDRVLQLYQGKYGDFGPRLAAEYLRKEDGEDLSEETLRRWLIAAGLWQPRRQGAVHRKWRERKAHFGEMVQMDGSIHDWFEGRREKASLMVMIDDATNRTYAQFFEEETTAAAMTVFLAYVERYGLPRSLYVDRDSIYETTRDSTVDEALSSKSAMTQFGRAMEELGVRLILAQSPQAKGRVERRHAVFQDRLVKVMRLKKISTLTVANQFLDEEYLDELNERFTVPAREKADVHRRVGRAVKLEHVLSFQEQRVVQNDWTVSWCNRHFQLHEDHHRLSLARKRIDVCELLDGTILLKFRGRTLKWAELTERPSRKPSTPAAKKTSGKLHQKPGENHPWRRPFTK